MTRAPEPWPWIDARTVQRWLWTIALAGFVWMAGFMAVNAGEGWR